MSTLPTFTSSNNQSPIKNKFHTLKSINCDFGSNISIEKERDKSSTPVLVDTNKNHSIGLIRFKSNGKFSKLRVNTSNTNVSNNLPDTPGKLKRIDVRPLPNSQINLVERSKKVIRLRKNHKKSSHSLLDILNHRKAKQRATQGRKCIESSVNLPVLPQE